MSSLLERARELLERCDAPTALAVTRAQLKAFLDEVIPLLESAERYRKEFEHWATSPPPPRIDLYPDPKSEARERRKRIIYEQAVKLYQQAPSTGYTLVGSTDNQSLRIQWAVKRAREIRAEVEKQEAGK